MDKDYVLERLSWKRTQDRSFQSLGSEEHRFQLNPVISEAEIKELENRFKIELPKD